MTTSLPMPIHPPLAVDERMLILSKLALENNFVDTHTGGADLSKLLIVLVDIVPANVLPFLAEQWRMLGPAGWEFATTEKEQRALLREAIALHKTKGTLYAVKRALLLLGTVAEIKLWHEYNPPRAPYTFTINLSPDHQPADAPILDTARLGQIAMMVNYWKAARSGFSFELKSTASLSTSMAVGGYGKVRQTLGMQIEEREISTSVLVATGAWSRIKQKVSMTIN